MPSIVVFHLPSALTTNALLHPDAINHGPPSTIPFSLDHINAWALLQLWRGFMSVEIITNEVTYIMFCATPNGNAPDSLLP